MRCMLNSNWGVYTSIFSPTDVKCTYKYTHFFLSKNGITLNILLLMFLKSNIQGAYPHARTLPNF